MDFYKFENSAFEIINNMIEEKEKIGETVGQEKIDELVAKMYSSETISEISTPLYETLISNAPKMYEEHRLEQTEFESRLQMRWLDAFYGLKSVITICEEIGMSLIDEFLEGKEQDSGKFLVPLEFDILFKLQAKSVVVSKEILTLLKSGYPDAALSRWRTLHEISVVLSIIANCLKDDEQLEVAKELAIRFYDRSILEEYNIKNIESERNTEGLKEFESIKEKKIEIEEKYGKSFRQEYEWARPVFSEINRKIYFSDLEGKSERDMLSSYYKRANSQIHSTSFGLYGSLGNIYDEKVDSIGTVFGPSNYGLSIPGQLAIISLTVCTTHILTIEPTLDKLMMCQTLQTFVEEYANIFDGVQEQIFKEAIDADEFNEN